MAAQEVLCIKCQLSVRHNDNVVSSNMCFRISGIQKKSDRQTRVDEVRLCVLRAGLRVLFCLSGDKRVPRTRSHSPLFTPPRTSTTGLEAPFLPQSPPELKLTQPLCKPQPLRFLSALWPDCHNSAAAPHISCKLSANRL